MSELRYAYDLYPRDDPRDGARILRFSDLEEAEWNAEANGTGSGVIILPGDSTDAGSIDPRGLQYIRVVEIDPDTVDGATLSGFAERVVHGFFLDTGSFDALTEQNTKRLTFGGAGTLSYWARAVMAPHTYIHDVFTGQDPFDRTWRLDQQSTVFANGNYTGAMLWRVLYELSHFRSGATYTHKHADGIIYNDAHDDDRTESAVPDAVIDFTAFLDSDGNAWTEKVGEFRVSVLDNGLSVIRLLMELGAYVEMDPHTFETRAYQASSHRRDRTGAAWGASVIRFQSPTDGTLATGNILSDAKRALTAHIQRSTMWAGGGDDVYAKATGTFDIPWEGGLNSDANDLDALEVQADRQITARSDAGDTLRVRTVPIDDPTSGLYRPLHSTGVLLDDLATVHNGAGQWDFDEQTFPVAAVGAKLREGGDWDTFVDLGASFRPMEGRQFQVAALGSHTHPPNPRLCEPGQPWTLPIEFLITQRWEDLHDGAERQFDVRFRNGVDVPRMRVMWTYVLATTSLMLQVQGTDQDSNDTSFGLTAEVISPVEGVDFLTRFRVEATEIMAKVWAVGDVEPGAWQVTVSDGGFSLTELGVSIINRLEDLFTTQYPSPTSFFTDSIQIVSGFGLGGFDRFTVASAGSWGNSEINGNAWETDQTFAASVGVTGGEAFYTASNAADDSLSSALIIPGTDGDCAEPIGPVCHVGSSGKAARCDHVHTADAANVSYSGTATGDTVEEALDSLVLAAASPTFVSIAKYLTD